MIFLEILAGHRRHTTFRALEGDTVLEDVDFLESSLNVALAISTNFDGNIAFQASNSLDYLIIEAAFFLLRRPLIIIPPFFNEEQRDFAFTDSGASWLIHEEPFIDDKRQRRVLNFYISKLNHSHKELPKNCSRVSFTSGSTSNPKGICLSQKMLIDSIQALQEALACQPSDRFMSFMPYAILLEVFSGFYLALFSGASCYVLSGVSKPESNSQQIYEEISRNSISITVMMPQMLSSLIEYMKADGLNSPESLRFIGLGGAHVPGSLIEDARLLGLPVFEGYGLTEAASVSCLNTYNKNKIATVGTALSHRQVEILEDGEIALLGDFDSSYCDGTAPFLKDGKLLTGDLGSLDENGFLSIKGRKKNIFINSHGRNISPEWLELELQKEAETIVAFAFGEGLKQPEAIVCLRENSNLSSFLEKVNVRLPSYAQFSRIHQVPTSFFEQESYRTANGRFRRSTIEKHFNLSQKRKEVQNERI